MRGIRLREPVSFRSLTLEERAARKAVDMKVVRKNVEMLGKRLRSRRVRQRGDGD